MGTVLQPALLRASVLGEKRKGHKNTAGVRKLGNALCGLAFQMDWDVLEAALQGFSRP